MNFKIEQIAIYMPNGSGAAAAHLLRSIGAKNWVHDVVTANGRVFGEPARNVAELSFNYESGPIELELLNYTEGANWMQFHELPTISHFGMHCSAEELAQWRNFFASFGINVAQEVDTESHTNPAIAGKRSYKYVIFSTRDVLGVDLKFIVRKDVS